MKLLKEDGKEFTGNARIITIGEITALQSYSTIVCYVDNRGFHRTWDGHSMSTTRHINLFRAAYGLHHINANEWRNMEVEPSPRKY